MDFLVFLEGLRAPWLTACFRAVTYLGEEVFLIVALCALYWCVNKKLAYGVGISFFASSLIAQGMKIVFRVERPWVLLPGFQPVSAALPTATGYSFPSGHTQSAAALFGSLGMASGKKRWMAASLAMILLVGLSRMYLGVHTPLDVFTSMAFTLVICAVVQWYLRKGYPDTILLAATFALAIPSLVYALTLGARGTVDPAELADCCKAAGGCVGCAAGFYAERRWIHFSTKTVRVWQQAVKLIVGLLVLLGIRVGGKALLGASLVADAVRYALIALWALALYPLVFSALLPRIGWAEAAK